MPGPADSPISTAELVEKLRERVLSHEDRGGRLPSESALAKMWTVTRGRIRTALHRLERQGLVVVAPGSGWAQDPSYRAQGMDRFQSFTQWARANGLEPGGRIIERPQRPATAQQSGQFRIRLGDPLHCFVRLRLLGAQPVMIERSTWAPWMSEIVAAFDDDVVSTTEALREAGVHVVEGDHRIEAVSASTEDARLLGVRRSAPLLQVTRVTKTREGRIVELGQDRYRAEAIAFDVAAGESARVAR